MSDIEKVRRLCPDERETLRCMAAVVEQLLNGCDMARGGLGWNEHMVKPYHHLREELLPRSRELLSP